MRNTCKLNYIRRSLLLLIILLITVSCATKINISDDVLLSITSNDLAEIDSINKITNGFSDRLIDSRIKEIKKFDESVWYQKKMEKFILIINYLINNIQKS